eukprot:m.141880 g.141880  ORF g.141880 m.141880 type:complete len:261 (+) comp11570_c0_seq3:480-1262(+)
MPTQRRRLGLSQTLTLTRRRGITDTVTVVLATTAVTVMTMSWCQTCYALPAANEPSATDIVNVTADAVAPQLVERTRRGMGTMGGMGSMGSMGMGQRGMGRGMAASSGSGTHSDGTAARAPQVRFVGLTTWDQDCTRQTHTDMDDAMHAACVSAYGNSARAASYAQVMDRIVEDLPHNSVGVDWLTLTNQIETCGWGSPVHERYGDRANCLEKPGGRYFLYPVVPWWGTRTWPISCDDPLWATDGFRDTNRGTLCVVPLQ